jgi:signal transduction histidine kinase
MQYRRRLRSRIIISFALLGFVLTALFAAATLQLRSSIENELIDNWLQTEAEDFVDFKRRNPAPDALYSFSREIEFRVFSRERAANIPFEWRDFDTGVYDIEEVDPDTGQARHFKLAVHRADDLSSFLRYDFSQEELSAQQLTFALFAAVAAFSLLALLIGMWSSTRVMRPVSDLAARLRSYSGGAQPEPLAPYFADDEVGQLAAALDDYSARLTEMVRRDREFNADVSHELRTPLAVIRGAVELLLTQSGLNEKTLGRLHRIERAVQQCSDLTGSLLTLSRGERAHGATDLRKVVEQLADANRIALGNKPLQLLVDGADGVLIDAPEAVIAVALGNLIGNACKYTGEGEVRITVAVDRVEIRDSGPGIAAEDASRLFERGYRGKGAEVSRGAGIGLAIVTRLCELYGWEASIAPRPEGGAIAVLRFNPAGGGRMLARPQAAAAES